MIEVDDFKAFDAHEVAEMLCLKYRTVTRYIQAGQIRARKIGKRSEEHTSELQSRRNLVCRLLLEKKKKQQPKMKNVRHR